MVTSRPHRLEATFSTVAQTTGVMLTWTVHRSLLLNRIRPNDTGTSIHLIHLRQCHSRRVRCIKLMAIFLNKSGASNMAIGITFPDGPSRLPMDVSNTEVFMPCPSGQDGSSGSCSNCAQGKYKIQPDGSPCLDCPQGTYMSSPSSGSISG